MSVIFNSEYKGYLVHFPSPSPPKKTRNIYPEKISYIFRKKNFLIFLDGFLQPQAQKTKTKKTHLKKFLMFFSPINFSYFGMTGDEAVKQKKFSYPRMNADQVSNKKNLLYSRMTAD